MDMISSAKWLSELEMDPPPAFNYQHQMNPIDYSIDEFGYNSFSSSEHSTLKPETAQNFQSSSGMERPSKQQKIISWGSCISDQNNNNITPQASSSSLNSQLISFDYSNSPVEGACQQFSFGVESTVKPKTKKTATSKTPFHPQEHVIAERKRREKINQRFIALSTVLPDLKKMDKASVLEDAAKYVKKLQEHINALEEKAAMKTVYVNKSDDNGDGDSSSGDENSEGGDVRQTTLPKLEARVCGRDVLIRVHCNKQKGILVTVLSEVQKLPLTILNTSSLPFGNASLDITIVAQMADNISITGKDILKTLRHVTS